MNRRGVRAVSGVSESGSAFVIADSIKKSKGKNLIIVPTEPKARRLADDLSFLTGENVIVMPEEEQLFLHFEAKNHDMSLQRINAMKALAGDEDCTVVAPVTAAVKRTAPHKLFAAKNLVIKRGQQRFLIDIREELVRLGYEKLGMVESPGEFSIRGGILDVFTPDSSRPYRIEFFDTEVDSIRSFDVATQRSVENLKYIEINPAQEIILDKDIFTKAAEKLRKVYDAHVNKLMKRGDEYAEIAENLKRRRDELCEYINAQNNVQLLENYLHYFYDETEYLWDYMEDGSLFIDDPDRICELLDFREKEMRADFELMLERGEIVPEDFELITGTGDFVGSYTRRPVTFLLPFPKQIKEIEEYDSLENMQCSPMMNFSGHMELLESELKSFIKKKYDIYITASTEERRKNLIEYCDRIGVLSFVNFRRGHLSSGFDFSQMKLCYISDNDIFGERRQMRKRTRKTPGGGRIENFSDLNTGDLVVHEAHGVGRFLGIEQLEIQREKKDYLKIKYAGNDLLYVPVEQFNIVQKYIGSDSVPPKLNKLSGTEWKVTKAKARKVIAEMTEELVRLYAERELQEGYAFSGDTGWQKEFEDSFPYAETEDQLRCAEEIKSDMEKTKPMDRLLCGDVGFGKTEVAARAIFKCVSDGKQAVVLVPTTVLANQHFYTLKERFEKFPVKVEMLSRFRTQVQQRKIIEDLRKGSIDLIIGTHRLLSKDVEYNDLGLLVVDEEHRFGVRHKEVIKKIKKNVDVLTLSATPIPRTLNMSLSGIKDMSLIETPPEERYPVQTYVMEQDEMTIRDVIRRELDRDGQVFIIYNRVNGIRQLAHKIETMVPDAQIAIGHGRMNEVALENVMLGFVNHDTNILISTTIVESGIDIPNANTMIIMDADRYGLAQLYQLRGRVGRSNRIAYAYLMYRKNKVINEVARKRLRAIREFTEFGSGFRVAMRDLEIRGAGNFLGSRQSGQMINVGYELYCKMIDEQVRKLKGEYVKEETEEISVELSVPANIPDRYIENDELKLSIYKKIAGVDSEESQSEMIDEMIDRFGDMPRETMNLIYVSRIRSLCEEVSVLRIYEKDKKVYFVFGEKNCLTPYAILEINDKFEKKAFVHLGKEPYISIPSVKGLLLKDCIELLTIILENRKKVN